MPHRRSLQFFVSCICGSSIGAFFSLAIGIHWTFGFIFGGIFCFVGFCINGFIQKFFPEEDTY